MAKSAGKTGSVRREARIFDWRTGRRIAAKVVLRCDDAGCLGQVFVGTSLLTDREFRSRRQGLAWLNGFAS